MGSNQSIEVVRTEEVHHSQKMKAFDTGLDSGLNEIKREKEKEQTLEETNQNKGIDFEILAQLARIPDVSTALSYVSYGCFAVGLWGVRLLYKAHWMGKIYRAADLDVLAGRAANRDAARLNRFMLAQHKILHRRAMFLFAIGPMSMAVYFVRRP
eukprot:gene9935-11651_t